MMSFSQSLLVALFCICVVFAVLLALWGIIRLFTAGVRLAAPSKEDTQPGKEG